MIVGILLIVIYGVFFAVSMYHYDLANRYATENPLRKSYQYIENHKDDIFDHICLAAQTVLDCNSTELDLIFNKTRPNMDWVPVAQFLESNYNCSGFSETIDLPYFYFTNRTLNGWGPGDSCTEALAGFLDRKKLFN